jgi:hypothetical protein
MSGRERRCRRKLGRIVVDPATNHVFVTGAASDSARRDPHDDRHRRVGRRGAGHDAGASRLAVSVFSEAYIRVYDVTDPTAPTQLGTTFAPQNADAINDITATPNGADVLVASGAPYELLALTLPGLTADGVYPTQPYPNSVAVSPKRLADRRRHDVLLRPGRVAVPRRQLDREDEVGLRQHERHPLPARARVQRRRLTPLCGLPGGVGDGRDPACPRGGHAAQGLGRPEDLRCGHRRRSRRVDHGPPRHVVVEPGAGGKLSLVVYYNGRAVVGVPQRIRFTFPRDAAHLGNTSAWVRFRVTA